MKVKDFLKYDPEAEVVFNSGFDGGYSIRGVSIDEGVYDSLTESWELLNENNLTDLEDKYSDGDGLDFVSLVVLNV
ncbi:hypothetical protein D3C85_293030 [compost metagenome]